MIYYSLRKINPDRFLLAKFNDNVTFDVEAVYDLWREDHESPLECNCPSQKRPCKHVQRLFPVMFPKVDTDEFFCDDTGLWEKPLAADFYDRGGVDAIIGEFTQDGVAEEKLKAEAMPAPKPFIRRV